MSDITAPQSTQSKDVSPATQSAFRLPSFRRYWIARLCGILATQMQGVAIGWQVYEMTQRPLDLGFVGLAQFLPALCLTLVTGHVADRYDRRRVLSICTFVEAKPCPAAAACQRCCLELLSLASGHHRWSGYRGIVICRWPSRRVLLL
jgi:MFS family permease